MEAVERSKHSPNTAQHLSRVGSPIRGAKQMNHGRHGGTPHSMPVPTTRQELEAAIAAIKGNTNLSRVRRTFNGGHNYHGHSTVSHTVLCFACQPPRPQLPALRPGMLMRKKLWLLQRYINEFEYEPKMPLPLTVIVSFAPSLISPVMCVVAFGLSDTTTLALCTLTFAATLDCNAFSSKPSSSCVKRCPFSVWRLYSWQYTSHLDHPWTR